MCIQRLKCATELIQKDDEARDAIGLTKPTIKELMESSSLKQMSATKCDEILNSLGLATNPPGGLKDK